MEKIVESLTINPNIKASYMRMAAIYVEKMPQSLYMNYYELAEATSISAMTWEAFLDIKEIDSWIMAKIAKLTESAARSALHKLSKSELSSNEISAIKELIAKSKILSQNQSQRPTVILTYIPQPAIESEVPALAKTTVN